LARDLIDGLRTARFHLCAVKPSARRIPWVLNPSSTLTDRELLLLIVQIEITPDSCRLQSRPTA